MKGRAGKTKQLLLLVVMVFFFCIFDGHRHSIRFDTHARHPSTWSARHIKWKMERELGKRDVVLPHGSKSRI